MFGFPATDFAVEIIAMWLFWSGVAWAVLAADRWRSHGLSAELLIPLAAALAGWLALVRLTTGMLGGSQLVPLYPVRLITNGLPYYCLAVALVAAYLLVRRVASRSKPALAATLALMVAAPAIAMPLLVRDLEEVDLFSDRTAATLAQRYPERPVTDPAHPGMVLVEAGPFLMGSLSPEQMALIIGNAEGDEQPVRTVRLDAFFIDRLEVTNEAFARFVAETGHVTDPERSGAGRVWGEVWETVRGADWRHPTGPADSIVGRDDHPVVQVSWNDATAFCAWAGKRLPTEAEWEKGARGTDGRDYPWGTPFDPTKLNYCGSECDLPQVPSGEHPDGYPGTAPVGSYPQGASPYGALDMAGNVWEWTSDWYDPDYYQYGPVDNPSGPTERRAFDSRKVVRGGSFAASASYVRTTSRSFDPVTFGYFGVGFRCAADG